MAGDVIYKPYRDVQPLVEAIENMSQYYIERGVDIFKEAISGTSFTIGRGKINEMC